MEEAEQVDVADAAESFEHRSHHPLGDAVIVLITSISALSSTGFAASQYALLSSLCAVPGSLVAGTSGLAIAGVEFGWFFTATALIGLPVALLCAWVWRLQGRRGPAGTP